jgi:hypothetical protein
MTDMEFPWFWVIVAGGAILLYVIFVEKPAWIKNLWNKAKRPPV